ncbi:MAG: hypothetical protein PHQ60_05475 [Sideroxydans sp.]|nr:hypothetical protein [Sideroxydans sp.]
MLAAGTANEVSTAGCKALATFDKKFEKLATNSKLKPPVVAPSVVIETQLPRKPINTPFSINRLT